MDDRLRSADPDLADTVRRILDKSGIQSEAAASSHKTVEVWNELWTVWSRHVAEVGEEKGPYANHKEHWHPPFLDYAALAKDLEEAAGPISDWIDRAFPLVKEPDLFLESLAEIDHNMRSLPEWFQPVEDNFVLGPRATFCVLRWTWHGLANQSEPGRKLVDLLCGLEISVKHSELDQITCCDFFWGLPEDASRQIHAYLREPQFFERLADLRSMWHRLQHGLESRFDRAGHLRACEKHLGYDWHYGQALIADALSRQDFAAAERFIEGTLSSLLRCSEEEPWRPEKFLLPESRYYQPQEESQAKLDLLDQWEGTAARLGKPERVASLRFQRILLQSSEDWATVLTALQEYQRSLRKPAAAERLFAEWKQRIAVACAPREPSNQDKTDTWTNRLIEAQRNPRSGQEAFIQHLDDWLACCRKEVALFQQNWHSLALLTRNLPQHPELQKGCPTFHSHVLVPALQVSGEMEKSLRQALAFLDDKAQRLNVRSVWERHLHTLVRSPEETGSCYRDSALWMRALAEVNPSLYAKMLAQWKTGFRRRRNLWADMASAGCPGL
jgi:hypothetical protein